jgi:hypothetical protein
MEGGRCGVLSFIDEVHVGSAGPARTGGWMNHVISNLTSQRQRFLSLGRFIVLI